MRIAHIALNLRLWHKGCHGIHNNNINRTGADHRFGNLKRLLPIIRLGNIKLVYIHPDILCIDRVEGVLRINKACDPTALLNLRNHM